MKAVFVPFIDAFGGVERLCLALSRFLHEEDISHEIVCFRDTVGLQALSSWPLSVRQLKPARSPIAEGMAVRRFLRDTHERPLLFDLKSGFYGAFADKDYCLHLTDPPSLLPADISKCAFSFPASMRPKRRSPMAMVRGEVVHRLNRRGVRTARTVLCMTRRIAAEIGELYSVRATVVPPGVPLRSVRKRRARDPGEVRVVSVSRLEVSKRIDWLLYAISHLKAHLASMGVHLHLEVIGAGPQERALKDLAASLNLGGNVAFKGAVSDEELEDLYSVSDVAAIPAAQGYGLPALEALVRGLAVVIHQESGVSEVLEDSRWVEITSGGHEKFEAAMFTMIRRIIDSEDLGRQPALNSDTDWARTISTLCGWI